MYSSARARTRRIRRARWLHALVAVVVFAAQFAGYTQVAGQREAKADSVGLRNTRVFMSPDTATTLTERALAGGGGIQAGDVLEYIVEFEPFENGAANGPGGWVTFYPPPGTEVVGASVVTLSNNDFVDVPVAPAGAAFDGPGPSGSQAPFGAPFASAVDGSLAQVYGDTGLFFSTDARTAKYVGGADPATTPLGNNGYAVDPTGCGQLIPVGWSNCWAHNDWDRQMTDMMGTAGGAIINSGRRNTPYLAGSPVAGPDSYYNLDYTGVVGPWQRIQYPGSQIAWGPAPDPAQVGLIAPDVATAWVPVTPGVNDGIALDEANPLPTTTTAVRFAIGGLAADDASLDDLQWIKFRLRVLSAPASCIPIDSEVFGGDAGAVEGGKDHMWRYYVPISATNSTCLALSKSGPSAVATDADFSYLVTFANTSPDTLTNVQVTDTLDPATIFVSASDGGSESGGVVTWPTIASMAPGEARQFTVQVTAPSAPASLENEVTSVSDQTAAVYALWQTDVVVPGPPSVTVSKSPSVGSVSEPGATVTFSVVVSNTSVQPVTVTSLTDNVFGDLLDAANPLVSSNTCPSQSTSLAIGGALSCSFDAFVAGGPGDPDHLDTITGVVEDALTNTASDFDSATVVFLDVLPSVGATKTPSVGSLMEPGGLVTFSLTVANTSVEPVTVTSLADDVFGDLLDPVNPLISNNVCLSLPASIAVSGVFACSFDGQVVGDFGDSDHLNSVTLTAQDDEANVASDTASATVVFGDLLPVGSVAKTPSSGAVEEPGATVTFTVDITNDGNEELTIESVADDVFGDLLDSTNALISANTCASLVATAPGNTTVSCSFDAFVAGDFGDPAHVNTVTVNLSDDDSNSITPSDDATVVFASDPGSIAGSVFLDLDGDPDLDSYEPGFENITVDLLDGVGTPVATSVTLADGSYLFTVVPVGDYTVVVDGAAIGVGYVGSVDPDPTIDDRTDVPVAAGEAVTGVDFGYRGVASVGDTVWIDENEDGAIDIDEPVLPDADVGLVWAGQDGVFATSDDYDFGVLVSGANGQYLFEDLPPGAYQLDVTTDNVAVEVTPTTATTITLGLFAGEVFVLGDFGFHTSGELPFTGLDAESLLLAAALLTGLSGLILLDGRKRERRFDLALGRIEE